MDGGNEFPCGCKSSKSLSCVKLEREEHAGDEWMVPDLCGNGYRDLDGVVMRTIWSDDCSQQKETDKNAVWRRQMKRPRLPNRFPPPSVGRGRETVTLKVATQATEKMEDFFMATSVWPRLPEDP